MDEIERLKSELRALKAEDTRVREAEQIRREIHQIVAKKQADEYRKKHPWMYKIAKLSMSIGKNIVTDTPEKRAKSKRANEQLKEMLKW